MDREDREGRSAAAGGSGEARRTNGPKKDFKQRVRERLDRLEQHQERIDQRLDRLEGHGGGLAEVVVVAVAKAVAVAVAKAVAENPVADSA